MPGAGVEVFKSTTEGQQGRPWCLPACCCWCCRHLLSSHMDKCPFHPTSMRWQAAMDPCLTVANSVSQSSLWGCPRNRAEGRLQPDLTLAHDPVLVSPPLCLKSLSSTDYMHNTPYLGRCFSRTCQDTIFNGLCFLSNCPCSCRPNLSLSQVQQLSSPPAREC